MGRKQTRNWKYVYLCIAGLIVALCFGCTTIKSVGKHIQAYDHVYRGKKQFEAKDLEGSAHEFNTVLSLSPKTTPGDSALFYLGILYAHYEYPGRNYNKSIYYFEKLINDFPESSLKERSKIWMEVLKDLQRKKYSPVKTIDVKTQDIKERDNTKEAKALTSDDLERGKKLLDMGDFKGALAESQRVLSKFPDTPPGDDALFTMALIFADYRNPDKDYNQSLFYFKRLVDEFPQSTLLEQTKTWVEVLNAIEKAKQVDIEIEQKRKELTQ